MRRFSNAALWAAIVWAGALSPALACNPCGGPPPIPQLPQVQYHEDIYGIRADGAFVPGINKVGVGTLTNSWCDSNGGGCAQSTATTTLAPPLGLTGLTGHVAGGSSGGDMGAGANVDVTVQVEAYDPNPPPSGLVTVNLQANFQTNALGNAVTEGWINSVYAENLLVACSPGNTSAPDCVGVPQAVNFSQDYQFPVNMAVPFVFQIQGAAGYGGIGLFSGQFDPQFTIAPADLAGNPGLELFVSPVSSVPEPPVWAELLLGVGLLGAVLRRARREGGASAFA